MSNIYHTKKDFPHRKQKEKQNKKKSHLGSKRVQRYGQRALATVILQGPPEKPPDKKKNTCPVKYWTKSLCALFVKD